MEFDVYSCMKNEEIREFFRKKKLSTWEQMQIILHSYASMQQKREWLSCLLEQVDEAEKQQIRHMIELIDACLYQIYQTDENVIYIADYMDITDGKEMNEFTDIITPETADISFYDEMPGMTEFLNEIYAPKPGEPDREFYIYQIIKAPQKKHRIKIEFIMTWIDGRLEIFEMYPDKEWLTEKGISKETINNFKSAGIRHKELPFKTGDRLKIKTPLMTEYIHGTLTHAEYDGCGCWYYFFTPDGKEMDINAENYAKDMIILNYHEMDLTSSYTVFDWVERE